MSSVRQIPSANISGDACVQDTAADVKWEARWISPSGAKHENYYFLARKSFHLDQLPESVILRIAADSRYALYVNGLFVGDGPVRGTHRRYFADCYDVTRRLRHGRNWIAAEVHCPVRATFSAAPNIPALLVEAPGIVWTDVSWQVRLDASHRRDAPLYTKQIGFSEWKDLRAENDGWTTGCDSPDGWEPAEIVGTPADFGGRTTERRPIGPLTSDEMFPVRLVGHGCVPDAGGELESAEYADLISREDHITPAASNLEGVAALCASGGAATVFPAAGRGGVYLILDFGREIFGHLSFDVDAPSGTVMDVAHDEIVEEGRIAGRRRDYRFADRFVLRDGRQTVSQRLHNRGFRYVQIVFRNFSKPIRIHSVKAVNRIYACAPAATFSCGDAFLNRLWDSCVNTMRLCAADTFMDCIWREQALWTNDQCVTNLFFLALTGDAAYAAHNLRMGADGALPNGLIPPVYPSDRSVLFSNLPALWTFSLHDCWLYSGDGAVLQEFLPVMEKGLGVYDAWREEDGLVPDQPGMWNFIDWGYGRNGDGLGGKTAALNMLIAAAYKRAATVEKVAGRGDLAAEYAGKSRQTLAAVNERFWDSTSGLYEDCTQPESKRTSSQHPLAVGLSFGLFDGAQRTAALKNLLRPDLVQAQLYFQHYVLDALAQSGRSGDALSVIRRRWGAMVEANAHTVWETSEGRTSFHNCGSLCHAFACAPLYFMQSAVLGVRPLQPGFREFAFAPQSVGLGRARGSVPTPHGPISVEWEAGAKGLLDVAFAVPEQTVAVTSAGVRYGPGKHRASIAPE